MAMRTVWHTACLLAIWTSAVMANGPGCGVCEDTSVCCSEAGAKDCCQADGSFLHRLIKPSDHCFDDFISPMSNFIYFEDPRTLTEARGVFFHHDLPNSIGTLGLPGGDIQL